MSTVLTPLRHTIFTSCKACLCGPTQPSRRTPLCLQCVGGFSPSFILAMTGLGASGLNTAASSQARVFGARLLPRTQIRVAARSTGHRTRSRQVMKPQCTATVENPIATDSHTNGTGNYYQRVYGNMKTGDTLDKDYANDTAATAKNRRAGKTLHRLVNVSSSASRTVQIDR